MVWNIVKNMFDNTDASGVLIMNGWNAEPEETSSNPRFYKCLMDWSWNDVDGIVEEVTILCSIIESIGRYCAENGLDINCEPDFEADLDLEDAAEYREIWEMFFGGYDFESIGENELEELAGQRLGRNINAYNVFIRARRLLTAIRLGAPALVINNERFELVRAVVLNCACTDMAYVDLSKDRFDTETRTLGEFNEADIERIFEIVSKDCSVIPDEGMGYTLLVNSIFRDIRIDMYKSFDRIKPTVDAVLGTLADTERRVLEKLYGLTDGVRRSYETTALEMHIPKPAIEWFDASATQRLRHPNRVLKLKNIFCESASADDAEI